MPCGNQREARVPRSSIDRRIASAERKLRLAKRELAERIGLMFGVPADHHPSRVDPSPHLGRTPGAAVQQARSRISVDPPQELAALLQGRAEALATLEDERALTGERETQREASDELVDRAALARLEKTTRELRAHLDAQAAALDELGGELEEARTAQRQTAEELEHARAEAAARESAISERERELAAREERVDARMAEGDAENLADRRPVEKDAPRAKPLPLGETVRRRRLWRGLTIDAAAAELGVPAKNLHAIEWDRLDLVGTPGDAHRILRKYGAFLGVAVGPAPVEDEATPSPPRPRRAARSLLVILLAVLGPPLVIGAIVYALEFSRGGAAVEQADPGPNASFPSPSRAGVGPTTGVSPVGQASEAPAGAAAPEASARPPVRLVLAAAEGGSWVEAHSGSPAGPLLYRGTLTSGEELPLSGRRLWLRLGAASNLTFTLNGRRTGPNLQGTVDVLVTPQGIRPT
jgi:hypothetical protein